MTEFHPYFTADGSVGLFNEEYNDIYHSSTGALTEAYEKFIYPIDFERLLENDSIKILDICYGIGYNTKSFLNFILEKKIKKQKFLDGIYSIYSDKISNKKSAYNDKIYDDNIFNKISFTLYDNDPILIFLSPFIKTGVKNKFKNNEISFGKINKYLETNKFKILPKINNSINYLLYQKLLENPYFKYVYKDILSVLNNPKYKSYFSKNLIGLFRLSNIYNDKSTVKRFLFSFLHNIYYMYISEHYKKTLKRYKLQDINFNISIDDARKSILRDNNIYNLIFLDAFTPSKCPCLWSLEFFQQLYSHLDSNGMLLTYSSAASVRNAMLNAGFYIGYVYNERLDKFNGTIAVKNPELIKYPLSEFDFGLLKTKAGIIYRDYNLTSQNEQILKNRIIEHETSQLKSASSYKKEFSKIL